MEILGVPLQMLFGQLTIGLVNGAFYALLSLGLAVIFGLLGIINFVHGAIYMLGAFAALYWLGEWGLGYWWALLLAPLCVGAFGAIVERTLLRRLYGDDPLYGMLATFGAALMLQGTFVNYFGSTGLPYPMPPEFAGAFDLGFLMLPKYRAWVVLFSLAVCCFTWYFIEKTKLGSYLRAATENPVIVESFGVNVPLLISLTYVFGTALAAMAGVMAAPIYQVSPLMGADLIIVVFAVVVIGGMGSIVGAIAAGFGLGVLEGMTKVFYPQASSTIIFVMMIAVLLIKPAGLFGRKDSV
jgi:branched-chain amino acid transport system permease protein